MLILLSVDVQYYLIREKIVFPFLSLNFFTCDEAENKMKDNNLSGSLIF